MPSTSRYSNLFPWSRTERGQGFFVPCLNTDEVRQAGLNEALRNRIAQLTDDFKTLDTYGETELTADQFEKYKQGVVNSITGVTNKIQDLQDELAILRGETTSQEQEFASAFSGPHRPGCRPSRLHMASRVSLLNRPPSSITDNRCGPREGIGVGPS